MVKQDNRLQRSERKETEREREEEEIERKEIQNTTQKQDDKKAKTRVK